MTTIYRLSSQAQGELPATLTIRRCFLNGEFSYKFSKMEFIVGSDEDNLIFDLVQGFGMRGLTIDIRDHCCTRPSAMRRYTNEGHEAENEYGEGVRQARYRFGLCERELVAIGLLVRIRRGNELLGHLLCDPQVGNGPPKSGSGFFPASLFNL